MRAVAFLALLCLGTGPAGSLATAPPGPPKRTGAGAARTVVLVSIDGMRWDDPERAGATHLARMAREGATAISGLVPPFPASTFPSHATLATGVYPDRHGIINNEFLDRDRGLFRRDGDAAWLLAEPLWVTAERQGIRAAVYHWICAATPWRGAAASLQEPYEAGVSDEAAMARVLEWLGLDDFARPRLILAYLHGPDAEAHAAGPASPEAMNRVRHSDRLIGRLMRALDATGVPSTLLVVSDHGMAPVSEVIRIDRLVSGSARRVVAISTGGTSNLYCRSDPAACSTAASVLGKVPGLSIYGRDELPADLRYRLPGRTGDLVAIAPRGAYFAGPEGRHAPPVRGMHGYRPEEPDMRGIFYARGAGIRPGSRRLLVRAIDIDPLVCRLLGIDPPPGLDGEAPAELLSETTPAAPRRRGELEGTDREALWPSGAPAGRP